MWKAFYEGNELLGWPLVALLVFIFTFTFVVLRVSTRRKSQASIDAHLASLPLFDDEPLPADGVRHE
jgi:type II secretory pathway component PulF